MIFTKFALLSLLSLAAARDAAQLPKQDPLLDDATSQGCFDALPSKADGKSQTFNSPGLCAQYCKEQKKSVAILKDVECICADVYPAKSALVDDDKCDTPCPGYAMSACGGKDAYSVINTGLDLAPGNDGDKGSSGSSAELTGSTKTAVVVTSAAGVSTTDSATTSPTTEAIQETTSVTKPEKASATESSTSESAVASTPTASASSVPENASRRLYNPIGNLVVLLRQLL
ncbi:SLG1 [Fusarium beomiforme]|uniref:SLG1 n=1 Tax=Fusarium beomiforme TaxID=44412 RepID=A0A9P5AFY8_9HYPO|nr:SLG1 [Fusarium beomiforme]